MATYIHTYIVHSSNGRDVYSGIADVVVVLGQPRSSCVLLGLCTPHAHMPGKTQVWLQLTCGMLLLA